MIKYGLRRFYYTLAHHCPDCNEPRKAVFRLHPFPVPARYGKGDWFYSDCSCIFSARRQERNQFQAMISQDFVDPLPVALRGHSFVNFKVGEYNRDAYEACTSFAKNFARIKDGKGLLLFGKSGAGKTHLACAVVNVLKEKYSVAFTYVPALMEEIRVRPNWLEKYLNVDLLVLDDLGTQRESDWALEKLLIIIDGRLNNYKPTIFTTNYDLLDLEHRVGMRQASMILGNNHQVLVGGPDWRTIHLSS
ncbi:MAG: ATP-binding protein [Firmicutes bacterium]|nr:ATP-binding protein [Bacillota bacterium]